MVMQRILATLSVVFAFGLIVCLAESQFFEDPPLPEEQMEELRAEWWDLHRKVYSNKAADSIGERSTIKLLKELLEIHERQMKVIKYARLRYEKVKYILDAYQVSKANCDASYLRQLSHKVQAHKHYQANILPLLKSIERRQLKACGSERGAPAPSESATKPKRGSKCSRFFKSCFSG